MKISKEDTSEIIRSSGVVYIATKKKVFLAEALVSADSVKQYCPELSITLFTDQIRHPICEASCFDRVIQVREEHGLISSWAEGQLERIRCLRETPYERTLHIDTDTRIVTSELPTLFHILEDNDVAMVEAAPDQSYSRIRYGRRMFSGGFILYRRNQLVWDLLDRWSALSERNFRLAGQEPLPSVPGLDDSADKATRIHLLCSDQIALVEILSPEVNSLGLKLKILDYSWNHKGSTLAENNRESPRILHYNRPRRHSGECRAEFDAAAQRRLTI